MKMHTIQSYYFHCKQNIHNYKNAYARLPERYCGLKATFQLYSTSLQTVRSAPDSGRANNDHSMSLQLAMTES